MKALYTFTLVSLLLIAGCSGKITSDLGSLVDDGATLTPDTTNNNSNPVNTAPPACVISGQPGNGIVAIDQAKGALTVEKDVELYFATATKAFTVTDQTLLQPDANDIHKVKAIKVGGPTAMILTAGSRVCAVQVTIVEKTASSPPSGGGMSPVPPVGVSFYAAYRFNINPIPKMAYAYHQGVAHNACKAAYGYAADALLGTFGWCNVLGVDFRNPFAQNPFLSGAPGRVGAVCEYNIFTKSIALYPGQVGEVVCKAHGFDGGSIQYDNSGAYVQPANVTATRAGAVDCFRSAIPGYPVLYEFRTVTTRPAGGFLYDVCRGAGRAVAAVGLGSQKSYYTTNPWSNSSVSLNGGLRVLCLAAPFTF